MENGEEAPDMVAPPASVLKCEPLRLRELRYGSRASSHLWLRILLRRVVMHGLHSLYQWSGSRPVPHKEDGSVLHVATLARCGIDPCQREGDSQQADGCNGDKREFHRPKFHECPLAIGIYAFFSGLSQNVAEFSACQFRFDAASDLCTGPGQPFRVTCSRASLPARFGFRR